MGKSRRFAVALGALALGSFWFFRGANGPRSGDDDTRMVAAEPFVTGQWIWSMADARTFARARGAGGGLVPAVFVATVTSTADGAVAWKRQLAPTIAGSRAAVVVRFDDSFHGVWEANAGSSVVERVLPPIAGLLAELRATSADLVEVQLDYDAPVRRLEAWGAVVRALSRGPLAGYPVWVTSIPAHLASAGFHSAYAGAVRGHVIQIFDTGLPCTEGNVESLAGRLRRAALPFRVGVGAFERAQTRGAQRTDHACWTAKTSELARVPGFSGTWVFGATFDTSAVFTRLAAEEARERGHANEGMFER